MKTTITKEFKWDCAHRLYNSEKNAEENKEIFGQCYNIHGHTYKMLIRVSALDNKLENGMVINFVKLKEIVNNIIVDWQDHALNLSMGDPLIDILNEQKDLKVNIIKGEMTCENQARIFWEMLQPYLEQENMKLEKIKLYETPTSYTSLTK